MIKRKILIKKTKVSWLVVSLYVLVIVGYPLTSTVSTYLGQQTQLFSIAYRALVLGLSLLLILSYVLKRRKNSNINPYLKYIFIFWILYFFRILLDTLIFPVPLSFGFKEYYLSAIGACLIPMIALVKPQKSENLEMVFVATLIAGVTSSILIWLINIRSGALFGGYNLWGGRLSLEALNPISVGHLGVTLIIISLYFMIVKDARLPKWILLGSLFVGSITAVAAASKGPFVALLVVFFLFFAAGFKGVNKTKSIVVLAMGVLIIYQSAQYAGEVLGFSSISRFQITENNASTYARLIAMDGAWNQFLENPLFGDSLEEKITQFYPHNILLESFMATGIFGGSVFILLMFMSIYKSYILMKYDLYYGLLAMLYIQYLVGALLSGSLWGSGQMWVLMGAILAVNLRQRNGNRYEKKNIAHLMK